MLKNGTAGRGRAGAGDARREQGAGPLQGAAGGVIYADSKKLRQTDQRGLIRRLVEVVKKHGDEDFTCRSGWL
ncbi:MAG: hypothetical protein ACLQU4_02660 [Limisphaerales bacterium]